MEVNDLINFNTISPILPLKENVSGFSPPRLSDVNNPFDNVLKKSMSLAPIEDKKIRNFSSENKENLNLISPLKTPIKSKKFNKISTSPLFLSTSNGENHPNVIRKDLERFELNDTGGEGNNSSLQFFDESFINNSLNCVLLASNDVFDQENESKGLENQTSELSSRNDKSAGSDFVDKLKSLEGKNIMSFLSEHQSEISRLSSNISKLNSMILDDGFIMTSTESTFAQPFRRRCMSASKPSRPKTLYDFSARKQLNNSIGGFDSEKFDLEHVLEKSIILKKKADGSFVQEKQADLDAIVPPWEEDNSILSLDEDVCNEDLKTNLKSTPKSKTNLKLTPNSKQNEAKMTPIKKENVLNLKKEIQSSSSEEVSPIKSSPEEKANSSTKHTDLNESFTIDNAKDKKSNEDRNVNDIIKNIKDFIHIKSNGSFSDEKKMGEDLLISLAKALDLNDKISESLCENLKDKKKNERLSLDGKSVSGDGNNVKKNDRLSLDSKIVDGKDVSVDKDVKKTEKLKIKTRPSLKNIEPKLKIQPIKSEKLQVKNLRATKNENEKGVAHKGPLKAVIPVKNMEKIKNSLLSKTPLQLAKTNVQMQNAVCTTPNTSPQIKKPTRTSTPLFTSSLKPQASSTPHFQKNPSASNATTPLRYQKRSSLPRPSSSPDINKSISPTKNNTANNTSGSVPNLSVSGKSISNISDRSKSLYRRRSAGDLKSGKMNSNLKTEESKPSVKRTISFSNKFVK